MSLIFQASDLVTRDFNAYCLSTRQRCADGEVILTPAPDSHVLGIAKIRVLAFRIIFVVAREPRNLQLVDEHIRCVLLSFGMGHFHSLLQCLCGAALITSQRPRQW